MELTAMRRLVERQKAERSVLVKQRRAERDKLVVLQKEEGDLVKARALIQQAALDTQGHLQTRLSTLVSTALEAVFPGQGLDFRLSFEAKRGRTECLLEIGENGVYNPPLDAHGGGVVDVVSFALRMSFWSMQRTRPVLIMDEPMKFVSPDLIPLAADMVRAMADKLGLQIIMVSHIIAFQDIADKVFHLKRVGNNSSLLK